MRGLHQLRRRPVRVADQQQVRPRLGIAPEGGDETEEDDDDEQPVPHRLTIHGGRGEGNPPLKSRCRDLTRRHLRGHQMHENVFSDAVVCRPLRSSPMRCERVGVVGTGIMGAGIAEVMATAGYEVIVRSRHETTAETTVMAIDKNLSRLVTKGRCTEDDKAATLERVRTTTSLRDLADCDLVIEAAPEDLELKRELFGDLGNLCRPDAVLATNTSTLSIIELAVAAFHPERVVGMHFFNPVPIMKLVEVIRGLATSDETVARTMALAEQLGKTPIPANDRAGFVSNRVLMPMINEAFY
ncbi:MAG: NAD(P)-binding domain-containing protein, partial [Acidimicrobiales bacterium]|nr:NAD(P)-binding domain-containing protein [Acidimicrobiales bacterium]